MSVREMSVQEHVDKVHLVLDNTEPLYKRKIAIFNVAEKNGNLDTLRDSLRKFADDAVIATNLSETADPFISGMAFLRVAGLVYVDLLTEYLEGDFLA